MEILLSSPGFAATLTMLVLLAVSIIYSFMASISNDRLKDEIADMRIECSAYYEELLSSNEELFQAKAKAAKLDREMQETRKQKSELEDALLKMSLVADQQKADLDALSKKLARKEEKEARMEGAKKKLLSMSTQNGSRRK